MTVPSRVLAACWQSHRSPAQMEGKACPARISEICFAGNDLLPQHYLLTFILTFPECFLEEQKHQPSAGPTGNHSSCFLFVSQKHHP